MKNLQISEANARKLYQTATPEFKQMLEDTFGKEFFNQSITERVKTYEDACAELGEEPDPNASAQDKLETITEALNEGIELDWHNVEQPKFTPWIKFTSSGFAFDVAGYDYSDALAGGASRLCLVTRELTEYAGRQFINLYAENLTSKRNRRKA